MPNSTTAVPAIPPEDLPAPGPGSVPLPLVADGRPGARFGVHAVLWANRRRFVVYDTATKTTIAIRSTRELADSDLIRLNMGVTTRQGPRAQTPHSGADPAARPSGTRIAQNGAPAGRRCGRCRGLFAFDTIPDTPALQDWWLCDPCHDTLLGTTRAASG